MFREAMIAYDVLGWWLDDRRRTNRVCPDLLPGNDGAKIHRLGFLEPSDGLWNGRDGWNEWFNGC